MSVVEILVFVAVRRHGIRTDLAFTTILIFNHHRLEVSRAV